MKTITIPMLAVAAAMAAGAAVAGGVRGDDPTRASALVEWNPSDAWEVSAWYTHGTRPVKGAGLKTDWTSERYAAGVAWSPVGWLSLQAFGGGARGRWEARMSDDGGMGCGGGAGASLRLWQFPEERVWAVTVKAEGSVARWCCGDEDKSGALAWTEWEASLPVEYHLSFTHNGRDADIRDFHSLSVWAGPAVGGVDGRWKRQGAREDFGEADSVGVAGGADLWLLERLRFWARVDWFGDATWSVGATFGF